tara:strand:- start:63 stop:551 length:489 start_codon:yes stop_codon:yes gene_type:complete
MAHFAELKLKQDPTGFTNNMLQVVERVVVVGNDTSINGGFLKDNDMHVDAETWCNNFFKGGTWKQTSYNGTFRKQYAGEGHIYHVESDKFISPQPHASWALDANHDWQAPVTYPTEKTNKSVSWDEENLRWHAAEDLEGTAPFDYFYWDVPTLAWIQYTPSE